MGRVVRFLIRKIFGRRETNDGIRGSRVDNTETYVYVYRVN